MTPCTSLVILVKTSVNFAEPSIYMCVVTTLLPSSTTHSDVMQFLCFTPNFSSSLAVTSSEPIVTVGECSTIESATNVGNIQIAPIGFFAE